MGAWHAKKKNLMGQGPKRMLSDETRLKKQKRINAKCNKCSGRPEELVMGRREKEVFASLARETLSTRVHEKLSDGKMK